MLYYKLQEVISDSAEKKHWLPKIKSGKDDLMSQIMSQLLYLQTISSTSSNNYLCVNIMPMIPIDILQIYETKNAAVPNADTRKLLYTILSGIPVLLKNFNQKISKMDIRFPCFNELKWPKVELLFNHMRHNFAHPTSLRVDNLRYLTTFFANLFCNHINLKPYSRSDYDVFYIAGDENLKSFYDNWIKNYIIQPRLLVGKYNIKDLPSMVENHLFGKSCLVFAPHIMDFCMMKEFTCLTHKETFKYHYFDNDKAPHPNEYAKEFVDGIKTFIESDGCDIIVGHFIPVNLTQVTRDRQSICTCKEPSELKKVCKKTESSFNNYGNKINSALLEACTLKQVPYLLSRMLSPRPFSDYGNMLQKDVGSYYCSIIKKLFLYEPFVSSKREDDGRFANQTSTNSFSSYEEIIGCGLGKGYDQKTSKEMREHYDYIGRQIKLHNAATSRTDKM